MTEAGRRARISSTGISLRMPFIIENPLPFTVL
jgi:hypothetical protein